MARRPCIGDGCTRVARPGGSRCDTCESDWQRARNARRPHYRGDWPKLAKAAVEAHRAAYGDWCPGWHRPPHPAANLTADHVDSRSLAKGIRVLCQPCNSARGNRPD